MKINILYFLLISIIIGCKNQSEKATKFETLLEQSSGQEYSTAKYWTEKGYYAVFKNEVTGEYTAYNLSKFNYRKMDDLGAYLEVAREGDIVTNLEQKLEWVEAGHWETESYQENVCDWEGQCWSETRTRDTDNWIDTSGYRYFYYGGGFRFENSQTRSHDLETLASLSEDVAKGIIRSHLQSEFSLTIDRASTLANLTWRYQRLESVRELTVEEKGKFAQEALGVSLAQIESSLRMKEAGNEAEYKKLLETSAIVNRTTPEKIGHFFEEYIYLQ